MCNAQKFPKAFCNGKAVIVLFTPALTDSVVLSKPESAKLGQCNIHCHIILPVIPLQAKQPNQLSRPYTSDLHKSSYRSPIILIHFEKHFSLPYVNS